MSQLRKNKLAALLAVTLVTMGCESYSEPKPSGKIEPVRSYSVDVWGSNPSIYEFTPEGHPDMACLILVNGNNASNGIQCFKK